MCVCVCVRERDVRSVVVLVQSVSRSRSRSFNFLLYGGAGGGGRGFAFIFTVLFLSFFLVEFPKSLDKTVPACTPGQAFSSRASTCHPCFSPQMVSIDYDAKESITVLYPTADESALTNLPCEER